MDERLQDSMKNIKIMRVVPALLLTFAFTGAVFASPSVTVNEGYIKVKANCVKVKIVNGRVTVDTNACHNIVS